MKGIVWIILFVIVVVGGAIIMNVIATNHFSNNRIIDKTFTVHVKSDDIVDYKSVDKGEGNFVIWNSVARKKVANYMKENNLLVNPGQYELRQGTTFEEALEILKFKKMQ